MPQEFNEAGVPTSAIPPVPIVRKKGLGYLGTLKRPGGGVSTEISIGVNIDGKETEIPSLVPTLTKQEINYLLGGGKPTKDIVSKAVAHARTRMASGKSPFAQQGEQGSQPIKRAKIMNPQLRKRRSYRVERKGSDSDAAVNDLVAQWAGKDLQPWLGKTGTDYPEIRTYAGLRTRARASISIPGQTSGIPDPVATSTESLEAILAQMQERQAEFATWLSEQGTDIGGAVGRAAADVTGQAEISRQSEARRMLGMGIDPTSGRFGALSRRSALDEARSKASAMTRARRTEMERGRGLRMRGEETIAGMFGDIGQVAGGIAEIEEAGTGRAWEAGEAARGRRWETGESEAEREWQEEQEERGYEREQEGSEAERARERQAQNREARRQARAQQPGTPEWAQAHGLANPMPWGRMKTGGIVVPNVYKVGEGGTKNRPRPELYISDTGKTTEVGKKGPETIAVRESGLIIPHPKTVKEMKERKCGGRVLSRQRGGRVRGRVIPESIMRAIGLIKGKYDADIIANLEGVAQGTRGRAQGMTMIPSDYQYEAGKRRKAIGLARNEKLREIAKHYRLGPGDMESIPAIYQPYREGRHFAGIGTSRETLERAIEQRTQGFDPNYPRTP